MHTDTNGRFVALSGTWEGKTLNLMSIYVPPRLYGQVLAKLGSLLLALPQGTHIAGRDYNSITNTNLDRWPLRMPSSTMPPLKGFMEAFGLSDLWRAHNPSSRQYSFHSGAHGSMLRIDHILVHAQHKYNCEDGRFLALGISKHSPVWTSLGHKVRKRRGGK